MKSATLIAVQAKSTSKKPLPPSKGSAKAQPSAALDPTVELIPKYKPHPRTLLHEERFLDEDWAKELKEWGGFNHLSGEWLPLRFSLDEMTLSDALDHITMVVEAGLVDQNGWSTQLFENEASLEEFLEELEAYDECYRIHDRWWHALSELVKGFGTEEGFIHTRDIAYVMRESIEEGIEKKKFLRAQADALAGTSTTPLVLTRQEGRLLDDHNSAMRIIGRSGAIETDISCRFSFPQLTLVLKDDKLFGQQLTPELLKDIKFAARQVKLAMTKSKAAPATKVAAASKRKS